MIDPTVEDRYWKDNYSSRPYVTSGASYNDYGPAYRYGYETYPKYHGKTFDDVESDLSQRLGPRQGHVAPDVERGEVRNEGLVPARERRDRARGAG